MRGGLYRAALEDALYRATPDPHSSAHPEPRQQGGTSSRSMRVDACTTRVSVHLRRAHAPAFARWERRIAAGTSLALYRTDAEDEHERGMTRTETACERSQNGTPRGNDGLIELYLRLDPGRASTDLPHHPRRGARHRRRAANAADLDHRRKARRGSRRRPLPGARPQPREPRPSRRGRVSSRPPPRDSRPATRPGEPRPATCLSPAPPPLPLPARLGRKPSRRRSRHDDG